MILIVKTYFYIVQNGKLLEKSDVLECSGNACPVDIDRTLSCNVLPVQFDNSFIRLILSGKKIKDCRLTCTVRTDQTVKFTFFYCELEIVDSPQTAELNTEVIYFVSSHPLTDGLQLISMITIRTME